MKMPPPPARLVALASSQDIVAVTDEMMRDMLANRMLAARDIPPRVIIDNEYIRNESSSVVNTNMLTDRLRIELNRAANGRMVFVGREYAGMVQKERDLKRDGAVDGGTIRETAAQAGAGLPAGGPDNFTGRFRPWRRHPVTLQPDHLRNGGHGTGHHHLERALRNAQGGT